MQKMRTHSFQYSSFIIEQKRHSYVYHLQKLQTVYFVRKLQNYIKTKSLIEVLFSNLSRPRLYQYFLLIVI